MLKILKRYINILFNASNILEKKRYVWVDYAKGLSIIMVVYRHTYTGMSALGLNINPYIKMVSYSISNFRMPMFFLLSGIFITRSLNSKGTIKLIQSKLNTILYPYLIWATIQVSLQILLGKYTTTPRTIKDYLFILYEPHMLDQFWYLYTLFNVTVIYILTKSKLHFSQIIQFLFGLILFFFSQSTKSTLINDTFNYYLYFIIGVSISSFFLSEEFYLLKTSPILFIILVPIFLFTQGYWLNNRQILTENSLLFALIALIGCVVMFNISFLMERFKIAKWLRVIGNHSLFIYIMHLMAEGMTRIILFHVFHIKNVALIFTLAVSMGILLPIIVYNLSLRMGFWYLYTYNKPHNVTTR